MTNKTIIGSRNSLFCKCTTCLDILSCVPHVLEFYHGISLDKLTANFSPHTTLKTRVAITVDSGIVWNGTL